MYEYTSRSADSEIVRAACLASPFLPRADSQYEFIQVVLTTSSIKQVYLIKYSVSVCCSGGQVNNIFRRFINVQTIQHFVYLSRSLCGSRS